MDAAAAIPPVITVDEAGDGRVDAMVDDDEDDVDDIISLLFLGIFGDMAIPIIVFMAH